jgi:uncharacterized protein YdhG (YjbR/CyaY superfamily)
VTRYFTAELNGVKRSDAEALDNYVSFPIKKMPMQDFASVDEYIQSFPADIQAILTRIRAIIKEKSPDAVESISYGMPAYKTFGKPLVYFSGYKTHIGLYATPSGHAAFEKELSKYKQGKGSVQFPLNQPIPFELISKIVEFRVMGNIDNFDKKKKY